MQFISNDSHKEDTLESEPILCQSTTSERTEESSSSCEIISISRDCHGDDLESVHIDETCHLVNSDQPQCRICLDTGGLYYLFCLVPFLYLKFSCPSWHARFLRDKLR